MHVRFRKRRTMSGLSIHEKRQLAEQLAREQLSKSGQYRFGIPQSVLNAKANEFMRLSDKEIQQKFNEYFQSTGLNAKPKDLWDSMGLNLEQKKKAEAHMKGLQKQINKKYMRPQKAVSKKSTTTKNELPSDVKLETRQIIVNLLKQAYANKNEEFRTYLLNNLCNSIFSNFCTTFCSHLSVFCNRAGAARNVHQSNIKG